MPDGAVRSDDLVLSPFDGKVLAQRPLERLLIPAELFGAFLDRKTSVVAEDVGVPTSAVLAIDDHVALDIASEAFVDAEGIKASRVASYVGRRRLQLLRRLVADREATVIVSNVLVTIIAALSKAFLEAVALVD